MFTILEKSGDGFPQAMLVEIDDIVLSADPDQKKFQVWRREGEYSGAEILFQSDSYQAAHRYYRNLGKKASSSKIANLMRQYAFVKPDATVADFARFLRLAKKKGLA